MKRYLDTLYWAALVEQQKPHDHGMGSIPAATSFLFSLGAGGCDL